MKLRNIENKHHWLGAFAVFLLLLLTLYYLWTIDPAEWEGATAYWSNHLWLFAVALTINYLGIACDFGAWSLMYRKFGLRIGLRTRLPLYFTLFAGTFMPLQSARLIRPMLARRLEPGSFAMSAAAEAALFYVDLVALVSVISLLGLIVVAPWFALPAAIALAGTGLVLAHVVFRRLAIAGRASDTRFWICRITFGVAALRAVDWLLQGLILFLLLRPLVTDIAFAPAALSALISTTLGAGSGLPGGVGATEGILSWFVGHTSMSAAHQAITVGAYRLITFYLMMPVGWICLLYLRSRLGRRETAARSLPQQPGEQAMAIADSSAPPA
jgi:hypothetical protein